MRRGWYHKTIASARLVQSFPGNRCCRRLLDDLSGDLTAELKVDNRDGRSLNLDEEVHLNPTVHRRGSKLSVPLFSEDVPTPAR
jgi:hypothetical protein